MPNIYLVGMPGAGKTTIGRQLARRRSCGFKDTDAEILQRTGVAVPVIFEIEGEAGFRDRESRVLTELARENGLVVATGGGIVLRAENRQLLKTSGTVIYLNVSPSLLFERTRHDANRPLLSVADPKARIVELFAQRDSLYREVADIVVESHGGSVGQMVRLIEKQLATPCAN